MLPGTFWLKVAWSPPDWRRPKTLALAASEPDLSQRLPVKREPTKVPRGWHGRNPGHSWPGEAKQYCLFESTDPGPDGQRHVGQAAVRAVWDLFFGETRDPKFVDEDSSQIGRAHV